MMDESLSTAVLHTPELRTLILENLVVKIQTFSDVWLALRHLALCKTWRDAASIVRKGIEQHWKMSFQTVLACEQRDMSFLNPDAFGLGFFKREHRRFEDSPYLSPYGLPELLVEMMCNAGRLDVGVGQFPLEFSHPRTIDYIAAGRRYHVPVSNIVVAGGATYIALQNGRVEKYHALPQDLPETPAYAWTRIYDDEDDQGTFDLVVAAGLCFVSYYDAEPPCIVALDADDLSERFTFGASELRNPLGIAWREGLLWVADCEGKLVAYSFEAPGPKLVHTIEGVDSPVGIATAHAHLYVTCRDEGRLHIFRPDDYIAQGSRSRFENVPHETLEVSGYELYGLAVHPELPLAVIAVEVEGGGGGEDQQGVAVVWSGSVLGCEHYHRAHLEAEARRRAEAEADRDSDAEDADSDAEDE